MIADCAPTENDWYCDHPALYKEIVELPLPIHLNAIETAIYPIYPEQRYQSHTLNLLEFYFASYMKYACKRITGIEIEIAGVRY